MLKHKITKIKNQLKENKSLHAGLICMTFQKCRLLIFFKLTFFRKNNKKKSGIPSVSNSLDPDQVQCVFGPVCEKCQA